MRLLLDERKENCDIREAVETACALGACSITGLKAGVNQIMYRPV
jgi:hypothetical protein